MTFDLGFDIIINVAGREINRDTESADVAELADALDSGSSEGNFIWVQVPSSAPAAPVFDRGRFLVFRKPLARRVVRKKTNVDHDGIKTPFAIIGVRSANCTNKQREVIQK